MRSNHTYFELEMDPGNCLQFIDSNKVINFIPYHSLQYIHLYIGLPTGDHEWSLVIIVLNSFLS